MSAWISNVQVFDFDFNKVRPNEVIINKLAKLKKYLPIFIACPYTRAIFLGGSVSLGTAGPESDIDLFVISKNNRVWLNKFFITLTLSLIGERRTKKKLADKFCLNIFLSNKNPSLPHQDEIGAEFYKNLIPVWSEDENEIKNFWSANSWIKKYYEPPSVSQKNIFSNNRFFLNTLRIIFEKVLDFSTLGFILEKISFKTQMSYLEKKLKESGALEKEAYDFFVTPNLIAYHFPISNYYRELEKHKQKSRIYYRG